MFDEPNQQKRENMVELLEELTLSAASQPESASMLRDERLSVDVQGKVRSADRSRFVGDEGAAARLVRIAAREFVMELAGPLAVGDHYVLSFDPEQLAFENADHAIMRCTACSEIGPESDGYRSVLRPYIDINLRRVLSGKKRPS